MNRDDLNAEHAETAERVNRLTRAVIGAAIEVHKNVGPGLLESAYHACLGFELHARGIAFEHEVPLPIEYRGHRLDCGYRMDFVIERQVVLEVKALEAVSAVHKAQVLSYLRLANLRAGLLINFHVKRLLDGVTRLVNEL